MKDDKYSIGQTAELTGVSIKQIRYWQSKGYIKDETRVICGKRAYRFFSDDDIKHIKNIHRLVQKGYALRFACKMAQEQL